MSLSLFLPIVFIYLFGLLNLFGIRQDLVIPSLIHFSIGISLFAVIRYLQMNLHFFRRNALFFYIFFLLLLVITLFFGMEINGSKRWIDLGLFPLQTSEIFKVFFIVYLANMFSLVNYNIEQRIIFLKGLFLAIIPFILVMRQPDLASSLIIFVIFMAMAINSKIPKKQIVTFFLVIIAASPAIWYGIHDYQRERVLSFLDAERDSSGTSYNMTQANISIGAGQFLGKGLGNGKQSQLAFLPEFHTDFAFSSFVEQFGFLGGAILISLFLWFVLNLFWSMYKKIYSKDKDDIYTFYYILGFSVIFISQTAINIGMNLGLLPIAGVTLPFISYGGSSLITMMVAMALVPKK